MRTGTSCRRANCIPFFDGCFDWHSAVHGYWLLLRCLRLYPELSCRDDIITLFADHLTPEKVAQELAYFNAPFRTSFERPYGYGWLLALAQELKQSSLPQAAGWYQTLAPLTQDIRNRLVDYLSKLTYPIPGLARITTLRLPSRWGSITPGRWKITRWRVPFWRRRRGFITRIPSIRLTMNRVVMSMCPAR